jgi:hypothetical protein
VAEASRSPRKLSGLVRVRDDDALRDVLSRAGRLDFGCKPTVIPEADGGFSVPVIADEEVLEALRAEGLELSVDELPEPQRDIGEGDRFEGGATPPRGFGAKVRDDGRNAGGGQS